MKKLYTFLLLLISVSILAQPNPEYYQPAIGKSNKELKTALHLIIKKGTRLSYGSGSNATWSGFEKSDLHPDGHVWDMYSNNKVKFPGGGSAASGMNIEHSVAKSWWGRTKNDAYKDLYHLNPSNTQANSARSSYPLGVNDGKNFNNGVIKVGSNTYHGEDNYTYKYTELCFEPLDEYKGDFARAYLYMFTCYEDLKWTGTSAPKMLNANETWPMLKEWARDLLVTWCRMDPVSEKELNRQNAIYLIQQNRNPFIDYPELVEYLWGTKQGEAFVIGDINNPYLSLPLYTQSVDFGTIPYEQTATKSLTVKGHNLTGDLSLSVTGTNSNLFNLSTQTISKEDAENGVEVIITYSAEDIGEHNVALSITGGGISERTVALKAKSSDDFMALPATLVAQNSFTANWTVSASATGYELDVYTFEGEIGEEPKDIVAEGFSDNKLPSAWAASGVYYFGTDNQDGAIRLGSSSNAGEVTISGLDLSVSESTLIVYAKQYGSDTNAKLIATLNNAQVGEWTTNTTFDEYRATLPKASETSRLVLSAKAKQRIYIDSVSISTQGEVLTKKTLSGYPLNLGNVLSHNVEGLDVNTSYYYTVIPQGNGKSISNPVKVLTTFTNSIENAADLNVFCVSATNGVSIYNVPQNSTIEIVDLLGRYIYNQTASSDVYVPLPQKGIYIMRVTANNHSTSLKFVY